MPLPKNAPLDLDYLRSQNWWRKVDVRSVDECWPWLLNVGSHGYGMAVVLPYARRHEGPSQTTAHRAAWALHHERQIPDGLTVDHVCRNKVCCNPAHLRLLTNLENARDNRQGDKTHCPSGHPYSGDNLRIYVNPNTGKTCRKCAACQERSNAARYQKTDAA